MGRLAKVMQGQSQPGLKAYAKGGPVHGDEAEDKKMIKKMVKPAALKAKGGPMKKGCK